MAYPKLKLNQDQTEQVIEWFEAEAIYERDGTVPDVGPSEEIQAAVDIAISTRPLLTHFGMESLGSTSMFTWLWTAKGHGDHITYWFGCLGPGEAMPPVKENRANAWQIELDVGGSKVDVHGLCRLLGYHLQSPDRLD